MYLLGITHWRNLGVMTGVAKFSQDAQTREDLAPTSQNTKKMF